MWSPRTLLFNGAARLGARSLAGRGRAPRFAGNASGAGEMIDWAARSRGPLATMSVRARPHMQTSVLTGAPAQWGAGSETKAAV